MLLAICKILFGASSAIQIHVLHKHGISNMNVRKGMLEMCLTT
jgi:hypothetical protein